MFGGSAVKSPLAATSSRVMSGGEEDLMFRLVIKFMLCLLFILIYSNS